MSDKITLSVIKADVGGYVGHSAIHEDLMEEARRYRLRVLGPNCLGIMAPGGFLHASFAHIQPLPGRLAFVAQSGAMIASVLDWATHRRIGFSHFGYS